MKQNLLPIFALIALGLFITIGLVIFSATMQTADQDTNYTHTNLTYEPYVIANAWWFGVVALLAIIAIVFVLWSVLK
jgi:hypothetical protein